MLPDAGANAALSVADLPTLDAGDHLHVAGYTLLRDGPPREPRSTALRARAGARA